LPDSKKKRLHECGVFSFCPRTTPYSPGFSGKYVSTWLGSSMAARSARNTAMGERLGALPEK